MKRLILSIAIILALLSCSSVRTPDSPPVRHLTVAGKTANFLQMIQAPDGHLVAWWVEQDEPTGEKYVYFSESSGADLSFRGSRRISPSRKVHAGGEHMPKLLVKPDGTFVIIFARRNSESESPFASSVLYTQSFDDGTTWTEPKPIHSDTIPDNSHGFPDATLLPDGEIAAVWLDGRHHLDHSTLYFAKTKGKSGFGKDKKIGGPACQCCKLDMYVGPNETLHLVYRGLTENNVRDIQHIASKDNGNSFTAPSRVSEDKWQLRACPHNGPSITRLRDQLYVTWYSEGGGRGLYYATSVDNGRSFSPRVKLATQAKHPYVASLGRSALAIWDEVYRYDQKIYSRVKMSIISDGKEVHSDYLSPLHTEAYMPYLIKTADGNVIATWTQHSDDGNALYYRTFSEE